MTTRQTIQAAAAAKAGAHVIQAPTLPEGAKGKPNACAAGAREGKSKWILFVDADTWFDPSFAPSLVSYAEHHDLEVVTAFLRQHTETLAERALLPYAVALYFTGVSAKNVNSLNSRECLANGQCLLFKRSAYQRIGGHQSVLRSVIEDVALAQRAKESGLKLRVIRAENLGHVRMYEGVRSIWRCFEKNSFRFPADQSMERSAGCPFLDSDHVLGPCAGACLPRSARCSSTPCPRVLQSHWSVVDSPFIASASLVSGSRMARSPGHLSVSVDRVEPECSLPSLAENPSGKNAMSERPLSYPVPWKLLFNLGPRFLDKTATSVDAFSAGICAQIHPAPSVAGCENLPPSARFVLVANHYQRKGLVDLASRCSADASHS